MLAPAYSYADKIKNPSDVLDDYINKDPDSYKFGLVDITDEDDFKGLEKSVGAMVSYMVLNIEGNSSGENVLKGNVNNLGNKFFLKTYLKCKDVKTKKEVDRHIYINNIPTGRYKLTGGAKTNLKGLIPGIVSNLESFNPFDAIKELIGSPTPDCVKLKLETIDNTNKTKPMEAYISLDDLKDMKKYDMHLTRKNNNEQYTDECLDNWSKGKNKCNAPYQLKPIENFFNRIFSSKSSESKPHDSNEIIPIYEVYYGAISILLMYIIYRLIYNRR